MNKLTIKQVENILDWSYPTALAWAREHGENDGQRWMVPVESVIGEIDQEQRRIDEMRDRLANHVLAFS